MFLSKREERCMTFAAGAARKGSDTFLHGAAITINGKLVITGWNHGRTVHTPFDRRREISCSTHAEMDAIYQWEHSFLRGKVKPCLQGGSEFS